eukprot:UN10527
MDLSANNNNNNNNVQSNGLIRNPTIQPFTPATEFLNPTTLKPGGDSSSSPYTQEPDSKVPAGVVFKEGKWVSLIEDDDPFAEIDDFVDLPEKPSNSSEKQRVCGNDDDIFGDWSDDEDNNNNNNKTTK